MIDTIPSGAPTVIQSESWKKQLNTRTPMTGDGHERRAETGNNQRWKHTHKWLGMPTQQRSHATVVLRLQYEEGQPFVHDSWNPRRRSLCSSTNITHKAGQPTLNVTASTTSNTTYLANAVRCHEREH